MSNPAINARYNVFLTEKTGTVTNTVATKDTVKTDKKCENPNEGIVTTNSNNNRIAKRKTIDIDATYDEYKNKPQDVLNALGIQYTDKQLNELKKLLSDKKSLKVFLQIASKTNLNAEDTVEAFKNIMNQKQSNIFKRGWIWLTNDLKTERECNAEVLSVNMHEIREIRGEELSTTTVINISSYVGTDENKKVNAMHFVEHKDPKGEFIYSEKNITDAISYLESNPDKANEFVNNTTELEAIKNVKGEPKYTGDTNISVGTRMTNNPELASTMKKVAHKQDMTDKYLENITAKLENNPYMQGAIEFSVDAKNEDGTDRFTANSINTEANLLVDKAKAFCNNYTENLKKLSKYNNITPEDLVKIDENVTKNPEIMSDVISKIENGTMTSKEILEYTENLTNNSNTSENAILNETEINNTEITNKQPESENELKTKIENEKEKENQIKQHSEEINKYIKNKLGVTPIIENENKESNTNEATIEINGKLYSERQIAEKLKINFGSLSDTILEAIKKDPRNIEIIKNYNGNPIIIKAYLENPQLVEKIKKVGGALSTSELNDSILLCSDRKSTELLLLAIENGGITNAIKITRIAQITGSKEDAISVLDNKMLSNSTKKQKLAALCGQEKKTDFIG